MFDIYKILDLSKYGEGWKDCSLKFKSISVLEAQKLAQIKDVDGDKASNMVVEILERYFVEGKAVSDGKVIDVKKEHIKDLPLEVLFEAISLFNPQLDEKKKTELKPALEE